MNIYAYLFLSLILLYPSNLVAATTMQSPYNIGQNKAIILNLTQREHPINILMPITDTEVDIVNKTYPNDKISNALNIMLIQGTDAKGQAYNVLVDTGLPSTLPAMLSKLDTLGLAPEQITHILITHAHGDHLGGLMNNDQVVFPKAQVIFSEQEYNYWNDPKNQDKKPAKTANIFKQWPQVITPYGQQVTSIAPDQEILPGIKFIAAYGHTPGHVGVLLTSESQNLLFWGDLLHAAKVQIPYPSISTNYDLDAQQAATTRENILQLAKQNKWLVSGVHMPDAIAMTLTE